MLPSDLRRGTTELQPSDAKARGVRAIPKRDKWTSEEHWIEVQIHLARLVEFEKKAHMYSNGYGGQLPAIINGVGPVTLSFDDEERAVRILLEDLREGSKQDTTSTVQNVPDWRQASHQWKAAAYGQLLKFLKIQGYRFSYRWLTSIYEMWMLAHDLGVTLPQDPLKMPSGLIPGNFGQ